MSLLTIKEQAQAALAFANKVLEFGPRAPEFTRHIQDGLAEFKLAAAMIGLAADGGGCTFEQAVAECPELGEKLGAAGLGANSGPFMDLLTQLLSNPVFMQLILTLLKIKTV